MIHDFADAAALAGVPASAVVVVGAGAAGLALALALGDRGRDVVLLESGGDAGDPTPPDGPSGGAAVGLRYDGLVTGRAHVLGGTTSLWHGQCMRLHDVDLLRRGWVERSGWPLSPSDLAPHYEVAEQWLRVSSRGYGAERWREHPQLPVLEWDPARLEHDFTEYTPTTSLARLHRPRLLRHARVRLVVHARVGRVMTNGARAVGVEVLGGNRRLELRSGTVVLAGGAVENARLLQLSDAEGIGLGQGRRATGRYLQDHPVIRTAQVLPRDHRVLQDRYLALRDGTRRLFPKVRLAAAAQERHGLLDATAVFVHDFDDPGLAAARRLVLSARGRSRPEAPVRDVLTALRSAPPVARTAFRRIVLGRATAERPSRVWLQLWLEQAPVADRRVELADDTDGFGLRRARVHWSCTDQELDTSRRMTRWIADDLSRLGVAEVRELPAMHDDDAWRASVTDAYHPAGTTRMSRSSGDGVVDPDLQVHGVDGLFVVGGSVFPTSGYANPTLTIVALALRLAGYLLRQPAVVAEPVSGVST